MSVDDGCRELNCWTLNKGIRYQALVVLMEVPKYGWLTPFPDVMAHSRVQTPDSTPEGWSFPKCNKHTKSSSKRRRISDGRDMKLWLFSVRREEY